MDFWNETCDLFFELSNETRLQILFQIKETPQTITTLGKTVGTSTQEVSRHVSRLMAMELAHRDNTGNIKITEYGNTVLFILSGLQFTSTHRTYFNTHTMAKIPDKYLSRLKELRNSVLIPDPMTVFQKIQEMSENAEEFIWRLTDKHLNIAYPFHQNAADRGVEFKLIELNDYEPSPGVTVMPRVEPSETRGLDNIPIFIALSEKQVAAIGFPVLNGGFDYHSFSSSDPKAIKWCSDVFQYYWRQGTRKE